MIQYQLNKNAQYQNYLIYKDSNEYHLHNINIKFNHLNYHFHYSNLILQYKLYNNVHLRRLYFLMNHNHNHKIMINLRILLNICILMENLKQQQQIINSLIIKIMLYLLKLYCEQQIQQMGNYEGFTIFNSNLILHISMYTIFQNYQLFQRNNILDNFLTIIN